jgi:hypothetical protein
LQGRGILIRLIRASPNVVLENSHDSDITYPGIHLNLQVSHQKLKVKKFQMNLAGDYLMLHENLPDRGDFFW